MPDLGAWLLVWALCVVLNVVPAFMPPTWALLAYFHISHGLDILPLAIVGAVGSAIGRTLLALLSQRAGDRFLPRRWRSNIAALADVLRERPGLSISTLLLYTLGPLPSNQLFIAAGISGAPLGPLAAVFAVTRCVSYIIWMTAASTAAATLQEALAPRLGATGALIGQALGLLALVLIMQVDWARWARRSQASAQVPQSD